MKISELKGSRIKRDIKAETVRKEYHNKHKDGSGNFGFSIRFNNGNLYRLDGNYNKDGNIYSLDYGKYSGIGMEIKYDNYENMICDINYLSIKNTKNP